MSYLIKLDSKSRKAGRFIARVHRNLQSAFIESGLKQHELAEKLQVDRSIINRRLQGKSNLTLRSIAELAWAMDNDVDVVFSKQDVAEGTNHFIGSKDTTTDTETTFFTGNHKTESVSEAIVT